MVYYVKQGQCIMCGACLRYCPQKAVIRQNGRAYILPHLCSGCGRCVFRCLTCAIHSQ